MADDTATPATPQVEPVTGETAQPDDLGDGGKKALAAERAAKKAAEKQLSELAKRLQEYEDRDKTEAQKLAERAETAERERDALRIESLRSRVAVVKGVPADLADFLTGTTEEELSAQADRLLARLAPSTDSRPRTDSDQGARPGVMPLNGDPIEDRLREVLGIRS